MGLPHTVEAEDVQINVDSILRTLLVIAWSMGLGLIFNEVFESFGLRLPAFVTSLFAGIVLTNTIPLAFPKLQDRWPTGTPPLALISNLSLGMFLAMSLMSLQLWTLADLAGSMLLLLIAQGIVIAGFTIFVVFPLMGRDYDAAVISGGYAGLGLGATPTAIANMEAITQKFGPSPTAFIVIPLVGAFFIDISNAFIIGFILDLIN
jgi:ESS family glutamate:Na+ symporter